MFVYLVYPSKLLTLILWGVGLGKHMLPYPTRAQSKAQGLLGKLSMVCVEEVSFGPYHSRPSPEVRMMGQRNDHPRKSLGGRLNTDQ